jgi:uncharacterized protein YndB with AHSA1/START domain
MARNQRLMAASPEQIFAVLSDPDAYGDWVVGSDFIRDADEGWPAVGTRFHHRVSFGPIKIDDHTEVIAVDEPERLQLKAKVRPLGTASVTLTLQRHGDATLVTMIEDAGDAVTKLVFNPLTHLLVRGRNVESLRRLEQLAVDRPERS